MFRQIKTVVFLKVGIVVAGSILAEAQSSGQSNTRFKPSAVVAADGGEGALSVVYEHKLMQTQEELYELEEKPVFVRFCDNCRLIHMLRLLPWQQVMKRST